MKTFWYRLGASIGILLRSAVYAAGIYGIAVSLWNREIPYLPVILLLTFSSWSKIMAIYDGVGHIISNMDKRKPNSTDVEKMVNLINFRNMYGGGPN